MLGLAHSEIPCCLSDGHQEWHLDTLSLVPHTQSNTAQIDSSIPHQANVSEFQFELSFQSLYTTTNPCQDGMTMTTTLLRMAIQLRKSGC
mmetsp:Transcript_52029/g.138692  ORF Transcript_52029/g.138692 Transcript_52029/m.138692 type:complete len:90 (+) Transcript_52029:81-350(+)